MKRDTIKASETGITVDQLTQENVETVLKLEEATKATASRGDRLAETITRFCGSMAFVIFHLVWYSMWIAVNLLLPEKSRFDPFPFPFLTLTVSLEAIFLSTFILISQNRQSQVSERRAHLDLQIDMLAEQENTKMLELLEKIAAKVGVESCHDAKTKALEEMVKPENLVRQIEQTMKDNRKK